jgi:hypothetical protein
MTTVPPAEIADATTFASSLTVQGAFTSPGIDDNADAVALTIDSSERVMIGTTTEGQETADNLTIADTGHCGITLRSGASSVGTIFFSDATSGADEYVGYVQYSHADNYMKWQTNGAERMRIDSSGKAGLGTASPTGSFHTTVKDSNGSDVYVVAQNTTSNRLAGFKVLDEGGTNSLQMEYDNGSNQANIRNPNNGSLAIYLGGVGSANKFSDYEEGTHQTVATMTTSGTVTLNTSFDRISYTKVGRLVTIIGNPRILTVSSPVGQLKFTLPFTAKSGQTDECRAGFIVYYYDNTAGSGSYTKQVNATVNEGTNVVKLDLTNSHNNNITADSSDEVLFSFSYMTA